MKFDWVTFGLQLVNALVLLAILRHFFFRPVAAIIAERQAATERAMTEAAQAKAEAEATSARAKAEAEATAGARHDVLVKAQTEAGAQRAALLDKAREEAAKIVEAGKTARDREAAAEGAAALGRARDLALTIAGKALSSQPADTAGYAARLAGALDALSARERDAILGGGHLALVSPAPLAGADLATAKAVLARFGIQPAPATDPALIAGLELRSDTGAVRNSLAHDLDQIAEALRDA